MNWFKTHIIHSITFGMTLMAIGLFTLSQSFWQISIIDRLPMQIGSLVMIGFGCFAIICTIYYNFHYEQQNYMDINK